MTAGASHLRCSLCSASTHATQTAAGCCLR
ncbi:hypothetical protein ACIA3K_12880 [Micromonospora sp. NPDC051543]